MKKNILNGIALVALFSMIISLYSCNNPVEAENINSNSPGSSKCYLYLTFDDGPLNGSENIDSVILAEKIKISVFLVGAHVAANREMTNYFKYYVENPYIDEYNHSFTHANNKYELFYSNPQTAIADIVKNQQFLKLPYKIVRLPGRNMWRINGRKKDDSISGASTADGLAALGYKVIGWDLEWQHKSDGIPVQSVDELVQEIDKRRIAQNSFTKNNIVLLIHDEMFQKKWEESELKQLIDKLKTNDKYTFEQIRFYPSNE